MESIVYQEKFIPCPNCTHPIGSLSPTCEKCGLPVSDVGIEELAEIEEKNQSALKDIVSLRGNLISSTIWILFAFLYYKISPESLIFILGFYGAWCLLFSARLARWHLKYSRMAFPDESFEKAKRIKNGAVIFFIGQVVLVTLYLYVNW